MVCSITHCMVSRYGRRATALGQADQVVECILANVFTMEMASAIADDPRLGSATEDLSDCRTTRHLLEESENIR